jgi:hypothetical protein
VQPGRSRRPPLSGYFDREGYVCIHLRGRYLRLARLVMEIVLGHPLQPGQDVHHRDGNKLNNCPSNLELQEHAYHVWEHKRTLPLLGRCRHCGIPFHWRLRYGKPQRFCSRACVIAARRCQPPQPTPDPFLRNLVLLSDHPAPLGAHLCGTTGVRPSPGAASSDPASTCEKSKTPLLPNHAAPEDGRTPVQPGLDAGGARKMPCAPPSFFADSLSLRTSVPRLAGS